MPFFKSQIKQREFFIQPNFHGNKTTNMKITLVKYQFIETNTYGRQSATFFNFED